MMPADVTAVSMSTNSEIDMMVKELVNMGADVRMQGHKCIVTNGEHHDFKTTIQTHAYLSGCLVFARSVIKHLDTTDTEASP